MTGVDESSTPIAPIFPAGMGPNEVFGRRIGAFLIDSLIIGVGLSLLVTPLMASSTPSPEAGQSVTEALRQLSDQLWLQPITWVITIVYFFVCESFFSGQTVGKRLLRLRVVMADGSPVTRGAAARRSLMRIIDELMCTFLVGLIAALTNPQRQRLGDRVGHTLVVDARVHSESWVVPQPDLEVPPVDGDAGLPGDENPWGAR